MSSIEKYYGVTITLKPYMYKLDPKQQYVQTYDHLQYLFGKNALMVCEQCKAGQIHYHLLFKSYEKTSADVDLTIKILLNPHKEFGFIRVQSLRSQKDKLQYIEYMMKNPYVNQTLCPDCKEEHEPHSPKVNIPDKCLFIDDENSD